MELDNDRLIQETVLAYRYYWTALLAAAEPIWTQLDLTILQLKSLVLLEVRDELTVGGIADALGMGRSSASALVEQLVRMGVAVRVEDDKDRRRSIVTLTEQGKELGARLHHGDERFMESLFKLLSGDDLIALQRGLRALAEAIAVSGS